MKKNNYFVIPNRNILLTLTFLISGIFLSSCSKEEAPIVNNIETEMSIIEILDSYSNDETTRRPNSKKPTFKTLSVALAKTGLAGTVSSNILTVFAPTDAAFAKLGLDQDNICLLYTSPSPRDA